MIYEDLLMLLSIMLGILMVRESGSIRGGLLLVGSYLCVSMIFLLLGSRMLGLMLIIVYIGAVAILILFVLMLVGDYKGQELNEGMYYVILGSVVFWLDLLGSEIGLDGLVNVVELLDNVEDIERLGVGLQGLRRVDVVIVGLLLVGGLIGGLRLVRRRG